MLAPLGLTRSGHWAGGGGLISLRCACRIDRVSPWRPPMCHKYTHGVHTGWLPGATRLQPELHRCQVLFHMKLRGGRAASRRCVAKRRPVVELYCGCRWDLTSRKPLSAALTGASKACLKALVSSGNGMLWDAVHNTTAESTWGSDAGWQLSRSSDWRSRVLVAGARKVEATGAATRPSKVKVKFTYLNDATCMPNTKICPQAPYKVRVGE